VGGRRLLIAAAVAALGTCLSGCLGLHVGRVAGRVIDAETGRGVSGVEIFRAYDLRPPQIMGEPSGQSFSPDWTTSGPNGEFELPSRWIFKPWRLDQSSLQLTWIHKDFGWGVERPGIHGVANLLVRVSPTQRQLDYLRGAIYFSSGAPCDYVRDDAYRHCESWVATLRQRRE
jgi:hypothetical protein